MVEDLLKQKLELLENKQQFTLDLVFHDPYFLNFLVLNDTCSKKDLEFAIIIELQKFIIELETIGNSLNNYESISR